MRNTEKFRRVVADAALVGVVLVWGSTFAIMKDLLQHITPFYFIFLRFLLAFLFLAILFWPCFAKNFNSRVFKKGFILGFFLAGGYFFQISGLNFTSATKAGFITGLSVVIVPFLQIFFYQPPKKQAVIGALMAGLGLFFLTFEGALAFNFGDLLVLFCAVSFALYIVLVGKFVLVEDYALLTVVQMAVVAFLAGLIVIFVEAPDPGFSFSFPASYWWLIIYIGLFATALAYVIESKAQKFTSPTRTAIIFSLEPVFAALFALILLGELIPPRGYLGGALIVAGMLVMEISFIGRKGEKNQW